MESRFRGVWWPRSLFLPTTSFWWATEYSGKTEAEIVADAGERACTICYPSAPVGVKGTKFFTPDEVEAAAEAEERKQLRAANAEKKAKSSLLPVHCKPLKFRGSEVRTVVTAKSELVRALAREFSPLTKDEKIAEWPSIIERLDFIAVVDALAVKEGKAHEAVIAEVKAKALKKIR